MQKSQLEAEKISPEKCRLLSKAEARLKKEREETWRLQYNGERRERRLHERLKKAQQESQMRFEERIEEGATHEGEVEELREKVRELRKDLARHNARDLSPRDFFFPMGYHDTSLFFAQRV